jgi:hypothetical protein
LGYMPLLTCWGMWIAVHHFAVGMALLLYAAGGTFLGVLTYGVIRITLGRQGQSSPDGRTRDSGARVQTGKRDKEHREE